MKQPTIDLIYMDTNGELTMSCAIVYGGMDARDKLLGPVPALNAVSALAPMLAEKMPDTFTVEQAISFLTVTHFRNMVCERNSSGLAYPYKVTS